MEENTKIQRNEKEKKKEIISIENHSGNHLNPNENHALPRHSIQGWCLSLPHRMRMALSSAQSTTSSQCDTCTSHVCSWSRCLLNLLYMFILPLLYLLHLFFTSFVFIAIETFRRESKLTRNTLHSENGLEAGSESQWIPPRLPRLPPLRPDWGSAQANAQSKKEAPRSMHWEPSHASDVPTCATMLHKSQLNTWTQMLLHCLFRILHILYIFYIPSTFQILPSRLEGTLVTSFAILTCVTSCVHDCACLHVTYTYVHV